MHRFAVATTVALAIVLAVPAAAQAGGWATTAVDRLPESPAAGQTWRPTITVKQHGIAPMQGLHPSVRITALDGTVRTYPARPAGGPGEYVADVRFPAAGSWSIRIFDGFTDVIPHELGTFSVSGPTAAAAPSDGGAPWPQAIAIAVVALLFTAAWWGLGSGMPPSDRWEARPRPSSRAASQP